MLWLHDTPYEKLFKLDESNRISNETIEQLQKITNILEKRKIPPSLIQIPIYVIIRLNRIESNTHQSILIEKIGAMLSCMTDFKFAWPTPEQVDTMYLYIKQDIQEENYGDNKDTTSTKTESKKEDSPGKCKNDKTNESDDEEIDHDEENNDSENNSIFTTIHHRTLESSRHGTDQTQKLGFHKTIT